MKIKVLLTVFTLGLLVGAQAQVITTFGTSVSDDGSGWTYTGATSSLSGSEASGAYLLNPLAPLSLDLSGANGLSLTAKVTTDPFSNFTITLEDGTGKVAIADFDWTGFVGANPTYTVVASFSTLTSGFNFADVDYWTIDSGSSGNAIAASFTNLSAIPEPSSFALLALGAGALGFMVRRRMAKA